MPSWGRQRAARLGQLRAQMAADEDELVQFDRDDPDFVRQDRQDSRHGESRGWPSAMGRPPGAPAVGCLDCGAGRLPR